MSFSPNGDKTVLESENSTARCPDMEHNWNECFCGVFRKCYASSLLYSLVAGGAVLFISELRLFCSKFSCGQTTLTDDDFKNFNFDKIATVRVLGQRSNDISSHPPVSININNNIHLHKNQHFANPKDRR